MTPILYSIDCPKCKVLQKKLSDARIQYAYCTDREEMVYRGITSLPMLLVNDVLLDFSEALDWISEQSPDEEDEIEDEYGKVGETCKEAEDEVNDAASTDDEICDETEEVEAE